MGLKRTSGLGLRQKSHATPKEETLCVELPGLVKAWNLERLQMECETEAPWRDWLRWWICGDFIPGSQVSAILFSVDLFFASLSSGFFSQVTIDFDELQAY